VCRPAGQLFELLQTVLQVHSRSVSVCERERVRQYTHRGLGRGPRCVCLGPWTLDLVSLFVCLFVCLFVYVANCLLPVVHLHVT
jgi:hypothetical protein